MEYDVLTLFMSHAYYESILLWQILPLNLWLEEKGEYMMQATQVVTIQNNDIVQFENDINNALLDLSDHLIIDIKYNTLYIGEQTVIHSALIIYK